MIYLFLLWRLIDFAIALIAPRFIPYLGFFPYKEILYEYGLPSFITAFGGFDGAQYITLVREGYNTYTQAYFPLYFLIVKAVSFIFPTPHSPRPYNDLLSALLVSNACFLAGLHVFNKYLGLLFEKHKKPIVWCIVLLLTFPTSFFFGAVYTEGLFFLLFASSLYFLKKKNHWLAGLFAALSSASRLMGVFLLIPFVFSLVGSRREGKLKSKLTGLFTLTPLIGLAIYCIYLWITVGDPFFFFNSQPAFGANRSTSLVPLPQVYYRYLKIFLTAAPNFQYFISVLEFAVFTLVFIILILDLVHQLRQKTKNLEMIGLNIFSFANILLPTLTGTFSSIPRYALFSVSFFLYLARVRNVFLKTAVACLFFIFHILLLGLFIQGYFIG